jgi:asparagine synthetase B (glutamine-hydrolysing)
MQGEASLGTVHGAFVLCWWDGRTRCLRLIRDRFGIEPFFYAQRGEAFEFASRIRDLPSVRANGFKPSLPGIVEFLTFCFLPDNATLDEGVVRVPAGSVVEFTPERAALRISRWYRLSFAQPLLTDEHEIATRFRALLEQSVQRQLGDGPVGAFLSGGMDSSSIVTFMRRHVDGPHPYVWFPLRRRLVRRSRTTRVGWPRRSAPSIARCSSTSRRHSGSPKRCASWRSRSATSALKSGPGYSRMRQAGQVEYC